jgi:hypothetical protein
LLFEINGRGMVPIRPADFDLVCDQGDQMNFGKKSPKKGCQIFLGATHQNAEN